MKLKELCVFDDAAFHRLIQPGAVFALWQSTEYLGINENCQWLVKGPG